MVGFIGGDQGSPWEPHTSQASVLCVLEVVDPLIHPHCWRILTWMTNLHDTFLAHQRVQLPTDESSTNLLSHQLKGPAAFYSKSVPHLQATLGRSLVVSKKEKN